VAQGTEARRQFTDWLCFRPEGGSGYTDQQVYERASLGGGLGYSEDRLRAMWDTGASPCARFGR